MTNIALFIKLLYYYLFICQNLVNCTICMKTLKSYHFGKMEERKSKGFGVPENKVEPGDIICKRRSATLKGKRERRDKFAWISYFRRAVYFSRVAEKVRVFASNLNDTLEFRVAYSLSTRRKEGRCFVLVSVRLCSAVETSRNREKLASLVVNDPVFDRFLLVSFKKNGLFDRQKKKGRIFEKICGPGCVN